MLDTLLKLVESRETLRLIREPSTNWRSLCVTYEDPHVHRLWTDSGTCRLSFHKIFPCEHPYFHAHAWPSAILLLKGSYEMALAAAPWGQNPPPEPAHRIVLGPGSAYEMLTPNEWHSVRPLKEPSYSIMLSGRPFEGLSREKGSGLNSTLPKRSMLDLLKDFEEILA